MPGGRADADRAVTALFREHHLELVPLALVMVGDLATAEDVVGRTLGPIQAAW